MVLGLLRTAGTPAAERPLDVTSIHDAHADFVWATLQRLGVRDADLEDSLQEVFVVVHQRLHTFDGSSQMTTWLFGIAMRVAAAHRRRAYVRREHTVVEMPEGSTGEESDPEQAAQRHQEHQQLSLLLDQLDLEKRAVFVMFEIEEMPCEEIAAIVGVPVGTVYSRLHAARKMFEAAAARLRARGERR